MYYGWKIVGATFATWFISVGFLFYSYGVFFPALEEDFGGSRFAISMGLAIMNIAMGLLAPFIGRAIDTWSIRWVMLIGTACMSAGFLAASRITALWQFYILLGSLLGIGASMIGQLPNSTLVSNWFIKRRGTALGVATMGISLSGVIMAPLTSWLIANYGWRTTFVVFGCLSASIAMPLVGLIVVNRPEDMGLYPDGASEAPFEPGWKQTAHGSASVARTRNEYADLRTADLIKDARFWAITLTVSLIFFATSAVLIHMIPHARDLGITPVRAAYVLTACAGVGMFGKVLFGYLTDFVDTRAALMVSIGFQVCGILLLLIAKSYPMLILVGAVFGMGMGGMVPLWGSLIGQHFGRESFGRVMGLMGPCMLPIQVVGVPYAGLVHDLTGEYTIAYWTYLGVYLLATICLLTLRRPAPEQSNLPFAARWQGIHK